MNMSQDQSYIYPQSEGMSATDVSMIIAGGAAALASIIYSLKHVKKSKCCGASCEQEVEDDEHVDQPEDLEKGSPPALVDQNITEL
tara:strand:+ start:920 stop:1177 length:258 start_codon:yes stop_codon:yes gene_type:complete